MNTTESRRKLPSITVGVQFHRAIRSCRNTTQAPDTPTGRHSRLYRECMEGMISYSNLIVGEWNGSRLIGIARCMTDFHYTCYLSDLVVSKKHQQFSVSKTLQSLVQNQLGPKYKLVLIAAPAANAYYEHVGFTTATASCKFSPFSERSIGDIKTRPCQ